MKKALSVIILIIVVCLIARKIGFFESIKESFYDPSMAAVLAGSLILFVAGVSMIIIDIIEKHNPGETEETQEEASGGAK
jgi:hypothetical protein